MTIRVSHWDTRDDSFAYSMQEEDVIMHTDVKCYLCTLYSTCRPLCNVGTHLRTIIEHTHAKILESALECQVS